MNIFVLNYNPVESAHMICDIHSSKMVLETAQILCSAFEPGEAPYKRTHYNHPCNIWARQSIQNYDWLIRYGVELAKEYTHRFGRRHKSQDVIEWCEKNKPNLPDTMLTPFALAMPDKYKSECPVESYRAYYKGEKNEIATWNKNRTPPSWWTT